MNTFWNCDRPSLPITLSTSVPMEPVLNSSEPVWLSLNHKEPDNIPLDIGGVLQTGLHVNTLRHLIANLYMCSPSIVLQRSRKPYTTIEFAYILKGSQVRQILWT